MTMYGDAANAKECASVAPQMGRVRHYHIRPRITVRVGLVVGGMPPDGYCARSNDTLPSSAQWGKLSECIAA